MNCLAKTLRLLNRLEGVRNPAGVVCDLDPIKNPTGQTSETDYGHDEAPQTREIDQKSGNPPSNMEDTHGNPKRPTGLSLFGRQSSSGVLPGQRFPNIVY